jgi:hypothetical protein
MQQPHTFRRALLSRARRPSASMCVALFALVIALDGSAVAKVIIRGSNIAKNAITSAKIKNHSIKSVDIAAGVIPPVGYSRAQSDGLFVSKAAAAANTAPDSAALGGKAASSFYDRTEADGRFVPIAPGTVNAAPNSAQLEGHTASAFPLKGTDVTSTLSLGAGAVPSHACTAFATTVTGAQVGDVAILGFVGAVAVPAGLTFQPLKVSSPDSMTLRICNPTNVGSPAAANVGVRIITFR